MNFSGEIPPAIILGMDITGLAIARSLGKHHIPIIGVDSNEFKIGSLSKYCDRAICPDPGKSESGFIDSLLKLGKTLPARGVLFPTNDEFVLSISKNRSVLDKYYVFSWPKGDIIETINDKLKFFLLAVEHGIVVPSTYHADNLDSLIHISKQIQYPCIIKPRFGYLFKKLKVKAVKCNKEQELIKHFQRIWSITGDIIIQELVTGNEDQQFSLCSYLNEDSEPLAVFTSRKIRQRPIGFGLGTLVESCYVPEILESGINFLRELKYCGISEMEIKKDARDGNFKVIEVNTRPWNQIGLAIRCGINFPLIAYRNLLGSNLGKVNSFFKPNVKWVWFGSDFYTSFGKFGYVPSGELTFKQWLRSLKGEKEYAIFAWDDPKPFLASFLRGFMSLCKKLTRI